ncbi:MAG: hypothetical protein RR585_00545 [Coprobacillus sp.]
MVTKNNVIIVCLIIVFAFLCFFLKEQLSSQNTLTTPVNNTTQFQDPSSQSKQDNSQQIYIDC